MGLDLHRQRLHGILFVVAASTLWSLNGAFINIINAKGAGPSGVTISCLRSLFAGVFLIPLAVGKWSSLGAQDRQGRWRPHLAAVACVIFFTAMTACFVIANTLTESANAILLQYTSTFWIFGLSPLVLKERPARDDVRCLVLAMIGIAIIFAGNAKATLSGLIIALLAGMFYGLLTMMIRKLRHVDAAALTVANCLGSAVLLFPLMFLTDPGDITTRSILLLILMGVVQFGVPYYLYSRGLSCLPAHQTALITLLEPILVPLWTYLAVGQTVHWMTIVGGVCILVAFAWVVQRSTYRMKAMAQAAPEALETTDR